MTLAHDMALLRKRQRAKRASADLYAELASLYAQRASLVKGVDQEIAEMEAVLAETKARRLREQVEEMERFFSVGSRETKP